MKRFLLMISIVCLCSGFAVTGLADTVVPQDIAKLAKADVAFMGMCTEATAKLEGSLLVTVYKFSVPSGGVIKGNIGNTFTFTQWGASKEESKKLGMPFVIGIPAYKVGNEYTLFLTAPSKRGFRAPIGLGYGKFNMVRGANGKLMAENDFGNRSLFTNASKLKGVSKAMSVAGIKSTAVSGGPIDFESLKTVVEQLQ